MDLKNKTYKDNKTGEIIKVIDSFENIAILESKEKIDTRKLTNPLYYTEQIDPSTFFNNQNAYNSLAEKIKSIPLENTKFEDEGPTDTFKVQVEDRGIRPTTNESAVIMTSEDEEKAELARKYGVTIDNTQMLAKQNESLAKYMDPEDLPVVTPMIQYPISDTSEQIQKIEVNRDGVQQVINESPIVRIDDPIISMFKNVKRVTDFSISIDIENKIPRLDFIEMMEESYEMSIIDFLSDEFTENLLKNPRIIRNMISEKIKEMVYGKEKNETVKIPTEKPSTKKRTKKEPKVDPSKIIKRDPLIIREDKEFPEKKSNEK